jgi:hypothetical protein
VPPALPQLLIAAALSALDLLVSAPARLGTLHIDALGLFLQVFALVNLRLGFRQLADQTRSQIPRRRWPVLPLLLGLLAAALITLQTIRDLQLPGAA